MIKLMLDGECWFVGDEGTAEINDAAAATAVNQKTEFIWGYDNCNGNDGKIKGEGLKG